MAAHTAALAFRIPLAKDVNTLSLASASNESSSVLTFLRIIVWNRSTRLRAIIDIAWKAQVRLSFRPLMDGYETSSLMRPSSRSLTHARSSLSAWRGDCNEHRQHSGLGWMTPAEFAQTINPRRDAVLRTRNGSAQQPAATAQNAATQNCWSELKTG